METLKEENRKLKAKGHSPLLTPNPDPYIEGEWHDPNLALTLIKGERARADTLPKSIRAMETSRVDIHAACDPNPNHNPNHERDRTSRSSRSAIAMCDPALSAIAMYDPALTLTSPPVGAIALPRHS